MRSIEICAGAGGQALGLEQAGFEHMALVEIDKNACETLLKNRPKWNVKEMDVKEFTANEYYGIDLFAGGVPCPPFSVAGKQLGHEDERNLFPEAIRLVGECMPKSILLENVRGLLDKKFDWYRKEITDRLEALGYSCFWNLINASDFGVPQLRPRTILVALQKGYDKYFSWPTSTGRTSKTIGELLYKEMASKGWKEAESWAALASGIAPTLVGGSKKHGGADLGPSRSKLAWEKLNVNGKGIGDEAPDENFVGMPKLTVKMAALVQGFPETWEITGKKTPAYRQIGNAFPPPVARAVGIQIRNAICQYESKEETEEYSYGRKAYRVAY